MKHQQAQTYQNIMSCQMNFARKNQDEAKALAQFLWSDAWTGFLPTELEGKTYPLEKMPCGGYCVHLQCSFPCPWLHLACERLCLTTNDCAQLRSLAHISEAPTSYTGDTAHLKLKYLVFEGAILFFLWRHRGALKW